MGEGPATGLSVGIQQIKIPVFTKLYSSSGGQTREINIEYVRYWLVLSRDVKAGKGSQTCLRRGLRRVDLSEKMVRGGLPEKTDQLTARLSCGSQGCYSGSTHALCLFHFPRFSSFSPMQTPQSCFTGLELDLLRPVLTLYERACLSPFKVWRWETVINQD